MTWGSASAPERAGAWGEVGVGSNASVVGRVFELDLDHEHDLELDLDLLLVVVDGCGRRALEQLGRRGQPALDVQARPLDRAKERLEDLRHLIESRMI